MKNGDKIICPLCNDTVDKLLYRFHIDSERAVLEKIKQHNPAWSLNDGACGRCIDFYHTAIVMQQRILPEIGPHFPVKSADDFVIIPTPIRVDAHPRYTGKGVTICFIDSGFYLHPDLTASRNRIKKIIDITGSKKPDLDAAWHGTMTTVVCAGDGYLSNGLYKGIACDAELVLLKVQNDNGKITTASFIKALQWIYEHHKEYNIRIVNISLRDDELCSYKESSVDRLAELLIEEGITIVAAVGNDESGKVYPPANSLHVIAVGGVDDGNKISDDFKPYHSTYGTTIDLLMKPELVAHAIWIAAPILPGTKEHAHASVLYKALAEAGNEGTVKQIQEAKYISGDYMHVDGTSFAAPIVTSIIAQMLEASPTLTPKDIRAILFSSARRLESVSPERQGYGIVQPRRAILKTLKRQIAMKSHTSPFIDPERKIIAFYIENTAAEQVSLSGSFNRWAQDVLLLEPSANGIWKIEIPLLREGKYTYKFFIDGKTWMEDVENPYREPDGFNGFNSLLFIQN